MAVGPPQQTAPAAESDPGAPRAHERADPRLGRIRYRRVRGRVRAGVPEGHRPRRDPTRDFASHDAL